MPHNFATRTIPLAVLLAYFSWTWQLAHASLPIPGEGLVMFDENPFNGSPRGFYRFDFGTHSLSLIAEVPDVGSRFSGFAWHPDEKVVYAGSENGQLFKIDLLTGTPTLVGDVPVTASGFGFNFIRGIAIEPGTNQLYGMGFGPRLYRIDSTDATAVDLGVVPNLDGGLAFSPDGTLYGWAPLFRLMTIDTSTLQTSVISNALFGVASNITSGPDGTIYGSFWQNGGIIQASPTTGIGTVIAEFPEHRNGAMGVFYYSFVPEPSTCGLGVSATLPWLLSAGRRRRVSAKTRARFMLPSLRQVGCHNGCSGLVPNPQPRLFCTSRS